MAQTNITQLNKIDLRQCLNNINLTTDSADDNPLVNLGIHSQYYDIDELHTVRDNLFKTNT